MAVGDKFRVLIVDDIAETRENIRKLLQFEPDIEVVGAARSGREGIELSRELRPDVVLMDINMPDLDGITATERIRTNFPAIQVVILSVQGDPNYMRKALQAGARDFLTKPPAASDLTSALRRAGRVAQEERSKTGAPVSVGSSTSVSVPAFSASRGKIIVVYSPKGGVGCTTLAINLAVALHTDQAPAILVDGNLQFGDILVFLNEQGKNSIADLTPRADELDREVVEEVMVTHKQSGLRVLSAPSRPEWAENITGEQFAKVIKYLRDIYPYVVIDSSSTLTDAVLAAMDVADLLILICTQDIPSIKNARLFLDLADGLKIVRKRILFVMNRYDKRIGITPEKVSENFRHEITAVLPADERVVIPSINRGVPFMIEDRSKPLAKAYLALAEQVRQRINELAVAEAEREIIMARRDKR